MRPGTRGLILCGTKPTDWLKEGRLRGTSGQGRLFNDPYTFHLLPFSALRSFHSAFTIASSRLLTAISHVHKTVPSAHKRVLLRSSFRRCHYEDTFPNPSPSSPILLLTLRELFFSHHCRKLQVISVESMSWSLVRVPCDKTVNLVSSIFRI